MAFLYNVFLIYFYIFVFLIRLIVLFGTTAGKALLGLYPYGERKPGWKEAYVRTWRVFVYGFGFGCFPTKRYRLFRDIEKGISIKWQGETEYKHRNWQGYYFIIPIVFAMCVIGILVAIRWSDYPRYQGNLTADEFAANFNDYNKYYGLCSGVTMSGDGFLMAGDDIAVTETNLEEIAYPRIEVLKGKGFVTGFIVNVQAQTKAMDSYPAYTRLLYLLTRSLMETKSHWFYQKEYLDALKQLTADEFQSFGVKTEAGEIHCERYLENGGFISPLDLVVSDSEEEPMRYNLIYTVKISD